MYEYSQKRRRMTMMSIQMFAMVMRIFEMVIRFTIRITH